MRALEEDLAGLAGLLRQSIFTDPDSPPAEAVSELDSIQDRLAELKVRDSQIRHHEILRYFSMRFASTLAVLRS